MEDHRLSSEEIRDRGANLNAALDFFWVAVHEPDLTRCWKSTEQPVWARSSRHGR